MFCNLIYKGEKVPQRVLQEAVDSLAYRMTLNKVKAGDIILCKSCTQYGTLIQWLTCQKLGIVPLLIPSDFSIEQALDLFKFVQFRLAVESSQMDTHVIRTCGKQENAAVECVPSGSLILMTSATTGDPKLVLRNHDNIKVGAAKYIERLKLSEKDVILPIVPFYHGFGFGGAMLMALEVGAKIVLPDIILPRNIIESCNRNNVSFLLGVPYFFGKMVDTDEKYVFNHKLRYVIAGGGPMKQGLQAAFLRRFQVPLLQQYGSTEAGTLTISDPFDEYDNVGRPFDGVTFSTEEHDGKSFLYVSASQTMGSYITENGIVDLNNGAYKMGDLGYINGSGKVILKGRADDVIIIGGEKISKAYVAGVIRKFEGIEGVRISLNNGPGLAELICEYSSGQDIEPDMLIRHCMAFLPEYQIPKRFIRVKNLHRSWKTAV